MRALEFSFSPSASAIGLICLRPAAIGEYKTKTKKYEVVEPMLYVRSVLALLAHLQGHFPRPRHSPHAHGHVYLSATWVLRMWDLVAIVAIPAVLVLIVSVYKDA